MLLGVIECIEFLVKCEYDNFLLNGVKHGFYTSSLLNSESYIYIYIYDVYSIMIAFIIKLRQQSFFFFFFFFFGVGGIWALNLLFNDKRFY